MPSNDPPKAQQAELVDIIKRIEADPSLKEQFRTDPNGALASLGIDVKTFKAYVDDEKSGSHKPGGVQSYTFGCLYIGVISPMWCRKTSWGATEA